MVLFCYESEGFIGCHRRWLYRLPSLGEMASVGLRPSVALSTRT